MAVSLGKKFPFTVGIGKKGINNKKDSTFAYCPFCIRRRINEAIAYL